MKKSPFKYGTTVSEAAFTNREQEVKQLYNNLTQGINTTIISPRRWGKSSLVEKVAKNIVEREQSIRIVLIDLFSVASQEEFLERYAKEVIKASTPKWQDWVKSGKTFFKQLVPRFTIGMDPQTDFSLSFDWQEMKQHKNEILNLPETIAEKKGLRYVICLDEFQNLANYPKYEEMEKQLRAIWQRHKHCCYCLYGSKRHMMADIFNNPSKPFYKFGDMMHLPKIATDKWVHFIHEGFKATDKQIRPDAAEMIASAMKNHSWYVQQLAHYTWNRTENTATTQEVKNAIEELMQANLPLYQKEVESISSTQLNLLKAVAQGETQLTSAEVMQKYRLGTPRNVSKNKVVLMNADIIQETNIGYEFLDPAFENWFSNKFLSSF